MRQLLGESDLIKSIDLTYPAKGSVLKGSFDITAKATNESGVRFYVDNTALPVPTKKNGQWMLEDVDSSAISDGSHTIKVTATYIDATTESKSVTVTVNNVVDTSNPTPMPDVQITSQSRKTVVDSDTPYTSYQLTIDGATTPPDNARMWVPIGVDPGDSIALVWFFHTAQTSEDSMTDYVAGASGGFTRPAGIVIDKGGAITLCINAGGTIYNNPEAERHALNAWRWVSERYNITKVYIQGESHGGALSTWLYGNNLLYGANVRGLLVLNAVYTTDSNLWWQSWLPDQSGIRAAYDGNRSAQQARNPASISSSKFSGKRVFSMVDPNNDNIVPASSNGIAFINKIKSVAADANYETHSAGHNRPGNANTRFMAKIAEWGGF